MTSEASGQYCTSTFHQIRFLVSYTRLSNFEESALPVQLLKDYEHAQLCIEYFHQTIICAATDTNLEPSSSRWECTDDGEKADGLVSNHLCRDFDQVLREAAEHSYDGDPRF